MKYRMYGPGEVPERLFRFRYEVWVEELKRPQSYACHDTRTLEDPLDAHAHHCVVTKDGRIIAAIRLNFLWEGDVEPYYSFYRMDRLDEETRATASISTRNMVAGAYRKTGVSIRMMTTLYQYAVENGAQTSFMDVNAPLVSLFERFGYVRLFERPHPDFGDVTVMRLNGYDLDHLNAVRSPFAPYCKAFLNRKAEPALV
ncbi:MAG: GNAT family N-acetyltransferase [Pseudomonadota bacterium]